MMKVLVVSNLFPPHALGGYERSCADVVDGLRSRGHDVRVLTSTWGVSEAVRDRQVDRCLQFLWTPAAEQHSFWRLAQVERHDIALAHGVIDAFGPEVIYVWNLSGLAKTLLATLLNCHVPVLCAAHDYWLMAGQSPWQHFWTRPRAGWRQWIKLWLKRYYVWRHWPVEYPVEQIAQTHFNSHFVKSTYVTENSTWSTAQVVHIGVRTQQWSRPEPRVRREEAPFRCLCIGYMYRHKGVHIIIKALARVVRDHDVTLTIAGGTRDVAYEEELHQLVEQLNLQTRVRFAGLVPQAELPQLMWQHDALVFPSEWPEPFSRTLLHAMAAGLPIVSTLTGGSGEALNPGVNCLTFSPGDADDLAEQLLRLITEDGMTQRLVAAAQHDVRNRFAFDQSLDVIETMLNDMAQNKCQMASMSGPAVVGVA